MEKNLFVQLCSPPPYLIALDVPNYPVNLICNKNNNEHDNSEISHVNQEGTPLTVDLNVTSFDPINHRLLKDLHSPVDLQIGRSFLNKCYPNLKDENDAYCLCNAQDSKRIILLGRGNGAGMFRRHVGYIRDFVDGSYIEENMTLFMIEHDKCAHMKHPNRKTSVKHVYVLHGTTMNEFTDLKKTLYSGSVSVEAFWNTYEYNILKSGAVIKLLLQALVGYETSNLYSLYEDLLFLQNCIALVSKKDLNNDDIIEYNFANLCSISEIYELFHPHQVTVKATSTSTNIPEAVQKMKYSTFMDKLWNIIKHSKTVGDVACCFQKLFKSLGDTSTSFCSQLQLYCSDIPMLLAQLITNTKSEMAHTVHLSLREALTLLIDLGLQRLNWTYDHIFKIYDREIAEKLQKLFNRHLPEIQQEDSHKFSLQLNYLSTLHIMLELVQIGQEGCSYFEDLNAIILKQAFDDFIVNSKWLDIGLLKKLVMYELEVPLNYTEVQLMKVRNLTAVQICITSSEHRSTAKSVYYFSKKQLFPHAIYDQLNMFAETPDKYYSTVFQTYVDPCL